LLLLQFTFIITGYKLYLLSPLELISQAKAGYRAAFYVHYFYIIYSVAATKTVCKSELNQSSTNIKRKS